MLFAQKVLFNDPLAKTGTTGDDLMGLFSGRDWWLRGNNIDYSGRYQDSTAYILRSIGKLSFPWSGYDDPDPFMRYRIWNIFGLGDHGVGLFSEATNINPDFTLPEVGRDLSAALLPASRGVGTLFSNASNSNDGVYVLISVESSIVLAIHGYEDVNNLGNALGVQVREGVHELLLSMGIGWNAISPEMIETGFLQTNAAGSRVMEVEYSNTVHR